MAPTLTPRRPTRPDPAAWRRAIGRRLREAREDARLRLVDVAVAARVSPQYLSEVERGLKEASSEVLAAVTGALGMTLVDLAGGVARDLARGLTGSGSLHLSAVDLGSPPSAPAAAGSLAAPSSAVAAPARGGVTLLAA